MTVEEIFAGVDIERRAGFRMQGTESPTALFASDVNVGEGGQHFQARMVGGEIFSAPQRPENLQNRRQPRHRPSLVIGRITRRKPVMDARECLPEKGKIRLGGVQMLGPATERRRIGRPIRVLERRRRLFPRVVLHKAPPQCLTASQQAVLGVRERKQRQEGEGLSATVAATAPDLDPIMVFIVCLFAAVSMADNRIAFTSGASPQDDFSAARGPIRFTLVRRDRKWDKQNA